VLQDVYFRVLLVINRSSTDNLTKKEDNPEKMKSVLLQFSVCLFENVENKVICFI